MEILLFKIKTGSFSLLKDNPKEPHQPPAGGISMGALRQGAAGLAMGRQVAVTQSSVPRSPAGTSCYTNTAIQAGSSSSA